MKLLKHRISAHLFQNFREFLVRNFDFDTANQAVPTYLLDQIEIAAANFAEGEAIRLIDRESLLAIKDALEMSYTDGITAITEAYLQPDDSITGKFIDKVNPKITKRLEFKLTDEELSYILVNDRELANFSEEDWLDFAAATKPKNCKKGIPCGGSCIAASKQCRISSLAQQTSNKKAIATAQENTKSLNKTPDTVLTIKAGIEKVDAKYKVKLSALEAQRNEKIKQIDQAFHLPLKDFEKVMDDFRKADKKYSDLIEKAELEKGKLIVKELKKTYEQPRMQQHHGMSEAEDMWSVKIGNTSFHGTEEFSADHTLVKTVSALLQQKDLPAHFIDSTKNVFFSKQLNKDDHYWQVKYNNPTHISGATGGDRNIVFYNTQNGSRIDEYIHETGHNFATKKYGGVDPPKLSDYGKAIKSPHPSEYGRKSKAEDFAETARMYFLDPKRLKEDAPERYHVFEKMMKDENYAG